LSIVSLFKNHVSREEPSLETLWFLHKEMMDKVQNLKSSNMIPVLICSISHWFQLSILMYYFCTLMVDMIFGYAKCS
jgi:hypothetical protein